MIPSLTLGRAEMANSEMAVVPNWRNPQTVGNFGSDLLQKLDVELDLAHRKINIFSQDHCPGAVVYWTDNYAVIPFTFGRWGNMVFRTSVNGVAMDGTISTGRAASTLDLRTAKNRVGIDVDTSNPIAFGDEGVAYKMRLQKLDLGGLAVMNPEMVLAPQPECANPSTLKGTAAVDGYEKADCGLVPLDVGTDVLKKLRIYISSKEKKIYVSGADATSAAAADKPQ